MAMGGRVYYLVSFALKAVRLLAFTATLSRLFQAGIVRGKNEYLYAFTAHAGCLYLRS